ncbi:MAG: 50S ribosomal protein L9 [Magnetovibrionaceae bacterium]
MDVILMERVENLGQMGDVVSVKPGFARNFLLPQGKAMRASEDNKKHFEAQRAQLEAANLKKRDEAQAIADKMESLTFSLIRQAGDAGQLYGSVNARDAATAIIEAGFTIDRHQVSLDKPIKTIGLHEILVRLHPEVAVIVTANVARSPEEAEIQLETGKAVIGSEEEEDEIEEEVFEAEAEDGEGEEAEAPAEEASEEAVAEEEPAS